MKSILKKISAAVACILMMTALSACGNSGADTDTDADPTGSAVTSETTAPAAEKPEWNELDQEEITKAMGAGWNLGNQLEASSQGIPSETAWGNPVITEEFIKVVKEQGFNTIRIPVSYLLKIGEAPDYTIEKEWLDRVQEVVDYVVNNDLFAVVNMHGDGYYTVDKGWLLCAEDDEAQKEIKAKYEAVWAQIAERFKDYDEHLIFEAMNEEFDNTYGQPNSDAYKNINDYSQIFVDTVRKTGSNNTKRWLLIAGWNTNIDYTAGHKDFVIPSDSLCEADGKRLMISVHFYDPYNFTIDESAGSWKYQWGSYAVENFDNWGQEDHVDKQMKKLYDNFVSQGYPVIIGEMGVNDKSAHDENQPEFRRYWYEYVVKSAKANGCIPIIWDNGWNGDKGLALFNRILKTPSKPEIIEAIMRAINSEGDYEIPAPKGFEK